MLSQRLPSKSDYNESISPDDFIAATQGASIRTNSEAENSIGSTLPIVTPIYLTHTTARLEQLLNDILVAETLLEQNIRHGGNEAEPLLYLLMPTIPVLMTLPFFLQELRRNNNNDGIAPVLVTVAMGFLLSACLYMANAQCYSTAREKYRKNGTFDDSFETLNKKLTANEVTQIQSTAISAGINNNYIDLLDSGNAMRKASAAFIHQRERILKAVHRNHQVEATLNALSIPTVLNELVLDYCSNPTLAR